MLSAITQNILMVELWQQFVLFFGNGCHEDGEQWWIPTLRGVWFLLQVSFLDIRVMEDIFVILLQLTNIEDGQQLFKLETDPNL